MDFKLKLWVYGGGGGGVLRGKAIEVETTMCLAGIAVIVLTSG